MNQTPTSHLAVSSQGFFRDFHDGIPMLIVLSAIIIWLINRKRG